MDENQVLKALTYITENPKPEEPTPFKLFCAGHQNTETEWLVELGGLVVDRIEDADVILFNGGTDVNPHLYDQDKGRYTESPDKARDTLEVSQFNYAKEKGLTLIGVCRGAQLLTVLAGGSLIQHVSGHNSTHAMKTYDGEIYNTGSWHHQMMYPFDIKNFCILGWSAGLVSEVHLNGRNKNILYPGDFVEPEVVYYPDIRALCIQSHPDWHSKTDIVRKWYKTLAKRLISRDAHTFWPKKGTRFQKDGITKHFAIDSPEHQLNLPLGEEA